jgi:hypothetical protein
MTGAGMLAAKSSSSIEVSVLIGQAGSRLIGYAGSLTSIPRNAGVGNGLIVDKIIHGAHDCLAINTLVRSLGSEKMGFLGKVGGQTRFVTGCPGRPVSQ